MSDIWNFLIVNPFTNILLLIYAFIGNFGVAIILFTILVRLLTHPFMASQIKSSAAMQEMMQSEEWLKIQEKYKNDKERLAQEQMKMYQEKGVNPFGSCLPTLLQFPIIIGLYQSITRAMSASPLQLLQLVRGIYPGLENITANASLSALIPIQSKFLWLDLGLVDPGLGASILPFGIPILAIIVGLTTYIQSKLTMPPSANPNDQSAMMSQQMSIMMPLMLFYFSLNFASGLAVYFITSNVVGIAQYAMLGKVNWRNLFGSGQATQTQSKSSGSRKK